MMTLMLLQLLPQPKKKLEACMKAMMMPLFLFLPLLPMMMVMLMLLLYWPLLPTILLTRAMLPKLMTMMKMMTAVAGGPAAAAEMLHREQQHASATWT